MRSFKGFSEAAKLYAENAAIVDAMFEKMHESIGEFVDCLTDKLAQDLAPIKIESEKKSSGWCSVAPESYKLPYIVFNRQPHTIVAPGELLFYVCGPWDATTDRDVDRVVALGRSPELQSLCLSASTTDWAILEGKTTFGSADPVEAVGKVFATILRQIATAYKRA
jgi:hypothetical protein